MRKPNSAFSRWRSELSVAGHHRPLLVRETVSKLVEVWWNVKVTGLRHSVFLLWSISMTNYTLPHPIPYQGSKRSLAPMISAYVPKRFDVWFEPFAGSAAMSLWVAAHFRPRKIVIGDSLVPMADLWREIITRPDKTADRYEHIWMGQLNSGDEYFNSVRNRFNTLGDPVDLLYLTCRCVKNAVRFNRNGSFTQSVDKRRKGMSPDKMRHRVFGASALLSGIVDVREGDWLDTTSDATPSDFVYLDPPYQGTSIGRDRRYAEGMSRDRLVNGLKSMRERQLRFGLSYDGQSGDRSYGPPLPEDLGLTHLLLHAGRSTQATLNGVKAETYESLYLSHGLAMAAPRENVEARQLELTGFDLAAA